MGYYQGDYYRGDPFFGQIFSALGGLIKSKVGSLFGGGGGGATKVIPAVGSKIGGIIPKLGGTLKKHPVLTAAGAAGAGGLLGAGAAHALGHHKKRRRMNVYNPRALRRAVRRAHGFARMAKKVLHIEHRFKHPKRWGRMGHFPKRRKRA